MERRNARPATPQSDAALARFFEFATSVEQRLEAGKPTYGDASFQKPLTEIVEEIREELLDVCGWAFILYDRLNLIEQNIRRVGYAEACGNSASSESQSQ